MCHALMNDPNCSLLEELNFAEKSEMRAILTHAILSTDMAKHAEEMELLYKCAANNPPFDKADKRSRYMLISFILHCAGKFEISLIRRLTLPCRYRGANARHLYRSQVGSVL